MTIGEYHLSDDFDFGPKVSVEIDGDLAKTLMQLAQVGAFGKDFCLAELEDLVHHLLKKGVRAGKRKHQLMLKESQEKFSPMDAEHEEAIQYFDKKRQPEDMDNKEENE